MGVVKRAFLCGGGGRFKRTNQALSVSPQSYAEEEEKRKVFFFPVIKREEDACQVGVGRGRKREKMYLFLFFFCESRGRKIGVILSRKRICETDRPNFIPLTHVSRIKEYAFYIRIFEFLRSHRFFFCGRGKGVNFAPVINVAARTC